MKKSNLNKHNDFWNRREKVTSMHLKFFGKVIHTNGIVWRYYMYNQNVKETILKWQVILGEFYEKENDINWEQEEKRKILMERLSKIKWFSSSK